jgi:hypothetical protein
LKAKAVFFDLFETLTTISFHQENLSDANAREDMKSHWEEVLQKLKTKITGGK